jgi:hypothetical protein
MSSAAIVPSMYAGTTPKGSPLAGKIIAPGRGAPGVIRGPYQPRKSRPCLYCGRIFADKEELRLHELREAAEFEREAVDFEADTRSNRVRQSDFESQSERFQQLIDRTDEEFGSDSCEGGEGQVANAGGRPAARDGADLVGPVSINGFGGSTSSPDHFPATHLNHFNQQQQHSHHRAVPTAYNTQYNHTSQYTSLERGSYHHHHHGEPPPAHEDQISQHGFLPPPPPLPVPQFAAQGCHNRGASDAEFPDPNEERTYTRLQSKDESHTCSSLLQVNSMSPTREVLDLSLPKPPDDQVGSVEETAGVKEEVDAAVAAADSSDADDPIKSEEYPSSNSSSEEDIDFAHKPESSGSEQLLLDHEGMVFFEPSSMPSMPEANLSCPSSKTPAAQEEADQQMTEGNGFRDEDWKKAMADDYSGLMDEPEDQYEEDQEMEEGEYQPDRSQSPLQFDDPNRIDCKFCGMIFDAPHVRKFHESSHDEELEEYDGELTRLFCGFCGKTFKKAQYRILHEKGHTGELSICCSFCDRRFRWESELRSHNRVFCTADSPAQPLGLKRWKSGSAASEGRRSSVQAKPPQSNGISPREAEREDWRSHPSLPGGWKLRSRPRPTMEGQKYFVFMSPEGQIFQSRRAVLQHMEKSGGYSREELRQMRLHCKTGPRGRRPKSLMDESGDNNSNNSLDLLNNSASNLDYNDSSNNMMDLSLDNYLNDDDDVVDGSNVEGKRKKSSRFRDRKFPHKRRVNKA